MTVIINELDHIPVTAERRPEDRSSVDSSGSVGSGQSPGIKAQVMHIIRRETSRQARLWAD